MSPITINEVHRLAKQLLPSEQLQLVEELARDLRQRQDFAGGEFPATVSASLAAAILPVEDFSDWEGK